MTELKALTRSIVDEIQSKVSNEKKRIKLLVESNQDLINLRSDLTRILVNNHLSPDYHQQHINAVCNDLAIRIEKPLYESSALLSKFGLKSSGYAHYSTSSGSLSNIEQTILDKLVITNISAEDLGTNPSEFVTNFIEEFLR